MSLEHAVTALMEADIFKGASKAELRRRGIPEFDYAIWYGNYFDGVARDKEAAYRLAKDAPGAEIWEYPHGISGFSSRVHGKKIYPV